MKEIVLKLDLYGEKEKKKAMRTVCKCSGIDSMSMDMKEKILTLIGEVDPWQVVGKLRKSWHTEIVSIGPATPASEEPEERRDDPYNPSEHMMPPVDHVRTCQAYPMTNYYVQRSYEENPNACVIC